MAHDETKPENGNGVRFAVEWLRLVTPALVTVTLFIITGVSFQVRTLDAKLFKHLTNHELHMPRQDIVNQTQFSLYCHFNDEAKDRFQKSVDDMRKDVSTLLAEMRSVNINTGGGS